MVYFQFNKKEKCQIEVGDNISMCEIMEGGGGKIPMNKWIKIERGEGVCIICVNSPFRLQLLCCRFITMLHTNVRVKRYLNQFVYTSVQLCTKGGYSLPPRKKNCDNIYIERDIPSPIFLKVSQIYLICKNLGLFKPCREASNIFYCRFQGFLG